MRVLRHKHRDFQSSVHPLLFRTSTMVLVAQIMGSGLHWAFPSDLRCAFIQWASPSKGIFFKKVWLASFFIILWTIWKEINERIFKQSSSSISNLQDLVLLRHSWWIKGWGDPFPYTSEDILRDPLCLNWSTPPSPRVPISLIEWCPPPHGMVKWNVDASMDPLNTKSAIGGVLRHHSGAFICLFSSPIPPMEINWAEVFAIHRAIKIHLSSNRTMSLKFCVESDSLNAVKWCNESNGGPWNLNFILNAIRGLTLKGEVEVKYKSRRSNFVADTLAKQGLTRNDEFLAWV